MKKILLPFFIFIFSFFYSQIRIELNVIENDQSFINEKKYKLIVKVINESDQKYLVPIDTTGFKNYMPDEVCSNFNLIEFYPDLGLLPMFKYNDVYLEGTGINYGHVTLMGKYNRKLRVFNNNKKKKLDKWIKDNRLKGLSIEKVQINKYLMSNLILLDGRQEIIFSKYFNPIKYNLNELFPSSYSYPIENNKTYQFSLQTCINESIYSNLTIMQKSQLKDYIFFSGNIESNIVNFKMSYNF
ncbi:hypothetical protein [Chryseobacterium sp. LAM-KRS1]|uniref:hypothetical protein n=1 Tax=Chryseobacterium sp. LAM-KRS1 TaxID=2715754 RepID=UPI0015523E9C|nr:hypothetical protein [Chryseobacterium sp. LAM-KRS1]